MTTDKFCFYLQNRLIQTSKTGGQQYSDTSLFSIPCFNIKVVVVDHKLLEILANSVARMVKQATNDTKLEGSNPAKMAKNVRLGWKC
jgi:hypothetical protein